MLGLAGKVVVDKGLQVNQEKLKEWLDSIPEIAREKESAVRIAMGTDLPVRISIESEFSTTILYFIAPRIEVR
jgi:hypothetical protein